MLWLNLIIYLEIKPQYLIEYSFDEESEGVNNESQSNKPQDNTPRSKNEESKEEQITAQQVPSQPQPRVVPERSAKSSTQPQPVTDFDFEKKSMQNDSIKRMKMSETQEHHTTSMRRQQSQHHNEPDPPSLVKMPSVSFNSPLIRQ